MEWNETVNTTEMEKFRMYDRYIDLLLTQGARIRLDVTECRLAPPASRPELAWALAALPPSKTFAYNANLA
jgi:hypothetical protein